MFTEQLPGIIAYISYFQGSACLDGDKNIHFENTLQSLIQHTLIILSQNGGTQG